MTVCLKPCFLTALVCRKHITSVLDGTRTQQCFPVALSCSFRKIGCYQKCIRTGGCHQTVLFRKADIIADTKAKYTKYRIRKNNLISRPDFP